MRYCATLILLMLLWLTNGALPTIQAQDICFPDQPDITACLNSSFSSYWQSNGGLPVFGYPVSVAQNELNVDLNTQIFSQWTERNRLEAHPQNPSPYNILLGRMGAERLAQIGRDPFQEGRESGPLPGCLWFEETGHNVCDQATGQGFMRYWQSHGLSIAGLDAFNRSLQLFGLPLTAPHMETNQSGDTVLTQWFERARFEWHPNNPDEYKVLLGLLGNEMRSANPGNNLPAPPSPGPSASSIFGVEINPGQAAKVAPQIKDAGVTWVRYNGILWSQVEATPGTRDWSKLDAVEAELRAISAAGARPIVIVRDTPAWARKVPSSCGPIQADALDDFASFMGDLVQRYSGPPYNVQIWEMGNEPDVDPSLVASDSIFGCWGDQNDPFYGGGYYADMLKQVYPAIKQANPAAQLMTGGILLDCDPTQPPDGKDCKPARFLEGILQNGGGAAFDILAYHAYVHWSPTDTDWDDQQSAWSHRGGTLLGKLDYLRSILKQYNVNKPIFMNEGGLLCYPTSVPCATRDPNFYNDQANYAVRLYSRAWASGLMGAVWYTLNGPGWRDGGMLDGSQEPRPSYQALTFMTSKLNGAQYVGALSQGGVEGYAFRRGNSTYNIYWTNNETSISVPLPTGTRTIYTYLGQTIAASSGTITVGFEPVIVEIAP